MRILYVEDNETNRALVERVMRAKQHTVLFREDGEGALALLAEDPTIHLILLDIELAGSINGMEVIESMRRRGDNRPVVAVTAYAMMGDRERFLMAGCDQYLPKPLIIPDLLAVIDEYEAEFDAKPAAPPEATVPARSNGAAADTAPAPAAATAPEPAAKPAKESSPPAATAPVQADTPAPEPAAKPATEPAPPPTAPAAASAPAPEAKPATESAPPAATTAPVKAEASPPEPAEDKADDRSV
jgi:CheY-like chemotaxis protein